MRIHLATCGIALALLAATAAPSSAKAQGFFSFFNSRSAPDMSRNEYPNAQPSGGGSLPYANEDNSDWLGRRPNFDRPRIVVQPRVAASTGGSQAFCVRTCDGRYFPIVASDNQTRAASCNSFCPASETKVVFGETIDHAATENGKSYSSLPNAFKYRTELVAGCTCNGKDQFGLASISPERDPTVQKGDIIASSHGLMVAGQNASAHGAPIRMTPATAAVRAKYDRVRVVASD